MCAYVHMWYVSWTYLPAPRQNMIHRKRRRTKPLPRPCAGIALVCVCVKHLSLNLSTSKLVSTTKPLI